MKAYINKILMLGALTTTLAFTSCVGDLDQLPADYNTMVADDFASNPREYIAGVAAKCYSGIAISGQGGAGSSDISGLDNGRSCWSRAIFMLNEMTTDECAWIWKDSGVYDLNTNTWGTNNENIFGTYSRLYTHIAVCNDFIRLTRELGDYGIEVGGGGPNAISQQEIDQLVQEARALRDLSYFYVIDLFGNGAYAWDDQPVGEEPPYNTRSELFKKVTADLEDVLANWDAAHGNSAVIYGRIGKDAVDALLAKFYLNAEVFTGTAQWDNCYKHCKNIIDRHQTGPHGNGLVKDYLSVFCGNNDMFAPGGSLPEQNEILWNIPYSYQLTESYGGSSFLILASISDQTKSLPSWYGINGQWTCMHARTQFSEKFPLSNGLSLNNDQRVYLWGTDADGFIIENTEFSEFKNGYTPIKFTNVRCEADGTMPLWSDPETGLPRAGVHNLALGSDANYGVEAIATFADTDYPVIRLAEIYLTAAEAILRSNFAVGTQDEGIKYVNYIRERAGLSGGSLMNAFTYTLDELLDERARELYWENCRRTDLIRFGKFTGNAYNWNWKNNVPRGAAFGSHMVLFPIPTQVIASYASPFPQNPGY